MLVDLDLDHFKNINDSLGHPVGDLLRVGVSIGVSFSPADGNDFSTLLRNADAARYHANTRGRNGYRFDTAELTSSALERWNHPEMGLVGADRFIPVAEESGLIIAIDAWVLQSACDQLCQWQRDGLPLKRVSVTLSGQQLRRGDLVGTVRQALAESGLAAQSLELEITEDFIMQQAEKAIGVLDQLRALGV